MEKSVTIRAKDMAKARELVASVRSTLEANYAQSDEDSTMEVDLAYQARWVREAKELEAMLAYCDGIRLSAATTPLEEVARGMLQQAVEELAECAAYDPPEWEQLDTALEDVAWWSTAHERVYRAVVANEAVAK